MVKWATVPAHEPPARAQTVTSGRNVASSVPPAAGLATSGGRKRNPGLPPPCTASLIAKEGCVGGAVIRVSVQPARSTRTVARRAGTARFTPLVPLTASPLVSTLQQRDRMVLDES